MRENGIQFLEFDYKGDKSLPNFLNFRQRSAIFGPFPKIYFKANRRLKLVDTSSVSERNRTSLLAQLLKNFSWERKVFLKREVKYLIIRELLAKSLGMECAFRKKLYFAVSNVERKPENHHKIKEIVTFCGNFLSNFELLRGLDWCKHSTTHELGVH